MTGIVKSISDRGFVFIKVIGKDKDVFLHHTGYLDNWEQMLHDFRMGIPVNISFDMETDKKGPRAANASRI